MLVQMELATKSVIDLSIANRLRNGYETVGSFKVVYINSFKQLDIANKFDYIRN